MSVDKTIVIQMNINTNLYKDRYLFKALPDMIRCFFYPFALENLFAMNGISLGRILMNSHAVKLSDNNFWKSPINKDASDEEIIKYLTELRSPSPHIKTIVDSLTIKAKK